ncbi:TIGR03943 family protein [Cytobacillus spongiae]|uniref:TIGR03943 family putative permease subunit n=1 Tax=Cytobacillus spongiae TaxID=2901381 RepID=UPI001F1C3B47|nr:TIGR03943 family protein [Cytobacillus spongiae]UII54877.1 TIGR03943 family protein [Cytobacillus spongiae]
MKMNLQQLGRCVIIAAFGAYFIMLQVTGDINKYINPKYSLMSKIAAGVFILFFFVQLFRIWEEKKQNHHEHDHCCDSGCDHQHDHQAPFYKRVVNYSIIVFPLITGFTLSPTVLDASIAEKKGSVFTQSKKNVEVVDSSVTEKQTTDESIVDENEPIVNENYLTQDVYDDEMKKLLELDQIEMKEEIFSPYYETISMDPSAFIGKKIKVSGFVYKEEGFDANQLVIARFLITHCVADAGIIGFLTDFADASQLDKDTWIELEGTIDVTDYHGSKLPMIKVNGWKIIQEPTDPYIYPVLTKVM